MVVRTHEPKGLTARPAKGRALLYHRDSSGKHDTTAPAYVGWACTYCQQNGLRFRATPETMLRLMKSRGGVSDDLFLDWAVSGNAVNRRALDALLAEVERDRTVSHVLIPRPDRLLRPDEAEAGIALERRFRQTLGVYLVFTTRVSPPLGIGEQMGLGDFMQAAIEYTQAGAFRRELAAKMLYSQVQLTKNGWSAGGRAPYGFQRCLVGPDGRIDRPLRDGESVRSRGFHVAMLPKEDETWQIRWRIKHELLTLPATEIARRLTKEGIPGPDANRIRRDNGIEHVVSGVWHQTTISNIGRDPIDSGVVTNGRRSMGDQLRHSPSGPRELTEADFREGKTPKVIQNPKETWTTGKAHFDPAFSSEQQATLEKELDARAGTQKGKPRSRTPELNPLGVRVFDMDCTWPMYRAPYNNTFRYVCGLYSQSHGGACAHNHIDGPLAVRFVLSVLKEQVLSPDRLTKLRQRVETLAADELGGNSQAALIASKKAALLQLQRQLETAQRNLAFAETENQRRRIALVVDEADAQEQRLQAEIIEREARETSTKDIKGEVDAAMKGLEQLPALADAAGDFAAARKLFDAVNARLFLKFADKKWGKRTLRKPVSGVLTLGLQPPPIQIYAGPTARGTLKSAKTETAALWAAVSDGSLPSQGLVSQDPPQGGDSLGNLNRGDRI
jgi:hypothetical protein